MRWRPAFFALLVIALYLNTAVLATFLLFDHLPIILDVVLLYFILPVAWAFTMARLTHRTYARLARRDENFEQSPLYLYIMSLSLVVWLISALGDWLESPRYLHLMQSPPQTLTAIPKNLGDMNKGDFIRVPEGKLEHEMQGMHHESGQIRNADSTIINNRDHYVAPISLSGQLTGIWMCDTTIYQKGAIPEKKRPPPFLLDLSLPRGFIIPKKRRYADCRAAIDEAAKSHGLHIIKPPIILEPAPPIDRVYQRYERVFTDYFLLINLVFVVLPAGFIHRRKSWA